MNSSASFKEDKVKPQKLSNFTLILFAMSRPPAIFSQVDPADIDFSSEVPFEEGMVSYSQGIDFSTHLSSLAVKDRGLWEKFSTEVSIEWYASVDHIPPFDRAKWDALDEGEKARGMIISIFGWHRRLFREDAVRLLAHLGNTSVADVRKVEVGGFTECELRLSVKDPTPALFACLRTGRLPLLGVDLFITCISAWPTSGMCFFGPFVLCGLYIVDYNPGPQLRSLLKHLLLLGVEGVDDTEGEAKGDGAGSGKSFPLGLAVDCVSGPWPLIWCRSSKEEEFLVSRLRLLRRCKWLSDLRIGRACVELLSRAAVGSLLLTINRTDLGEKDHRRRVVLWCDTKCTQHDAHLLAQEIGHQILEVSPLVKKVGGERSFDKRALKMSFKGVSGAAALSSFLASPGGRLREKLFRVEIALPAVPGKQFKQSWNAKSWKEVSVGTGTTATSAPASQTQGGGRAVESIQREELKGLIATGVAQALTDYVPPPPPPPSQPPSLYPAQGLVVSSRTLNEVAATRGEVESLRLSVAFMVDQLRTLEMGQQAFVATNKHTKLEKWEDARDAALADMALSEEFHNTRMDNIHRPAAAFAEELAEDVDKLHDNLEMAVPESLSSSIQFLRAFEVYESEEEADGENSQDGDGDGGGDDAEAITAGALTSRDGNRAVSPIMVTPGQRDCDGAASMSPSLKQLSRMRLHSLATKRAYRVQNGAVLRSPVPAKRGRGRGRGGSGGLRRSRRVGMKGVTPGSVGPGGGT